MSAAVIEEDDDVRDSLRALLESMGLEVREYTSAEDYLSRQDGDAQCMLVHHHMPGMTGLDLLERLRAQGDQTPALLVTGSASTMLARQAQRIGVKVLEKPNIAAPVISWVEAVCGPRPA